MSSFQVFALAALVLLALAGLLYWQLSIAEGAYLGRRVVVWLYDRFASRYEAVKAYDADWERDTLAEPVVAFLARWPAVERAAAPAALDVATGTGRFAAALLGHPGFSGRVIALDLSSRMLAIARVKLAPFGDRATLRRADAQTLEDEDSAFDVVACLEALEFLPNPDTALGELIRVCRPGGLLVLTNRIGPDAWKMPGRTQPTPVFARRLADLGLLRTRRVPWLVDYDLVFAEKP
ncbi:MAG: class I SAM-dependent methyltransferase [Thermoflexales bacterium]